MHIQNIKSTQLIERCPNEQKTLLPSCPRRSYLSPPLLSLGVRRWRRAGQEQLRAGSLMRKEMLWDVSDPEEDVKEGAFGSWRDQFWSDGETMKGICVLRRSSEGGRPRDHRGRWSGKIASHILLTSTA